jgi:hypothetical protein
VDRRGPAVEHALNAVAERRSEGVGLGRERRVPRHVAADDHRDRDARDVARGTAGSPGVGRGDAVAIVPNALAGTRDVRLVGRRLVDGRDERFPVSEDRDGRRERRQSRGEVVGAVERIDYPPVRLVAGELARLLGEHRVVRKRLAYDREHPGLRRHVGGRFHVVRTVLGLGVAVPIPSAKLRAPREDGRPRDRLYLVVIAHAAGFEEGRETNFGRDVPPRRKAGAGRRRTGASGEYPGYRPTNPESRSRSDSPPSLR